jgi:uncharacterized protein
LSTATKVLLDETVVGGTARVSVDEALIEVTIDLNPDGSGEMFDAQKILDLLQHKRITENIDFAGLDEKIAQIAESNEPVVGFLIAHGVAANEPEDAYLEYPVIDAMGKRDTDPDDPVEFSKIHIVNVREGETVAVYFPMAIGEPGTDVYGALLPVLQAKDETPKTGRNLTTEHVNYVSTIDGRLVIEKGGIYVTEEVVFREDLTVVQGDIDFVGKLKVEGSVEAGVRLNVGKGIRVTGSIIGCDVECSGDLIADISLVGSEDTKISVSGNLTTSFVENANLDVYGNVEIKDSFVTSALRCSGRLDMTKGKGHFVSGTAAARDGIEVNQAGIPVGSKVKLSVGRDLLAEAEKIQIAEQMEPLAETLETIRKLNDKIGPMTTAYQHMPQSKKDELELLLEQEPIMQKNCAVFQARLDQLQPRLIPTHDTRITINGAAYPDVVLEFPLVRRKLTDSIKEVIFYFGHDNCKVEEMSADEDAA